MRVKAAVLERHGDIVTRGVKYVDGGAGRIEGYASTYNNVDRVGDRVMPGAFGDASFTVPYLAYHDNTRPIGQCLCVPDAVGLASSVTLADTPTAQEVRELARVRAIPAQSIGYLTLASEPNEFGGADLYKIEVLEVSAVPIPANPLALISAAKAFGRAATDDEVRAVIASMGTWDIATKARLRDAIQGMHDIAVKAGADCGKGAAGHHADLELALAILDADLS